MWELIEPKTPNVKPKVGPDEVTVYIKKNPHKSFSLVFNFGEKVARELKFITDRPVTILWGKDKQANKVKICPYQGGPKWFVRDSRNKKLKRIYTSALPENHALELGQIKVKNEVIVASAKETVPYIIIDLPKDFFV